MFNRNCNLSILLNNFKLYSINELSQFVSHRICRSLYNIFNFFCPGFRIDFKKKNFSMSQHSIMMGFELYVKVHYLFPPRAHPYGHATAYRCTAVQLQRLRLPLSEIPSLFFCFLWFILLFYNRHLNFSSFVRITIKQINVKYYNSRKTSPFKFLHYKKLFHVSLCIRCIKKNFVIICI